MSKILITPKRSGNSLMLRIPYQIADWLDIDEKTEFSWDIGREKSDGSYAIIYNVKKNDQLRSRTDPSGPA